jgi:DNA-binding MarR family transcriptional regulator
MQRMRLDRQSSAISRTTGFENQQVGQMAKEVRWTDDFSEAWAREYPDATDTSDLLLITLLARLSVLIETFEQETLGPFELTPSDYAVLAALRRAGAPYELAPNHLYTALERSSGGMTKMLKRLEKLAFIKRVSDPEDRRGKLVRLTPAGKRVEAEAFRAFLSSTHELLQSASRNDLDIIGDAMRSLLAIIERHFYR